MNKLSQAGFAYAAAFALGLAAVSLLAYIASARFSPSPSGELYNKYLYLRDNPDSYGLVFMGDSRAFCAVQPEKVDAALGTKSFNLAHWTNWLPTQYPLARDVAKFLPRDTVVVLFIGHINFRDSNIYDKYPISLFGIPEYLEMGFPLSQLYDNLASFNPLLRFYHKRAVVRTLLFQALDRPLCILKTGQGPNRNASHGEAALARRIRALGRLPQVASMEILRNKGKATSVALHKNNGSYERIELDETYFREKQRTGASSPPPDSPDPRYVRLYRNILAEFKKAGARLVIVELEEAPYIYGTAENRERWRSFLRSFARPMAGEYGFPYVTLPLEDIPDAGYFDYDHMNSKGIKSFTAMLAKALAPYITDAQRGE